MRARLKSRAPDAIREASQAVCDHLKLLYPVGGRFGLFAPMPDGGEIDVREFGLEVVACWPKVGATGLTFHECRSDELLPGVWAIPEPADDLPTVDPRGFDALIVPGLAFDASGNRLGQGGGYYDRLLTARRPRRVIAVGFDDQVLASVPTEVFDQPVDAVVTPTRYIECGTAEE